MSSTPIHINDTDKDGLPHGSALPVKADGYTRLFLVRHGETDWNVARRYQGHTDIELNANGAAQAKRLASRLESLSWFNVDHAYSSDLSRAAITADTLLSHLSIPLQLNAELRERDFGIMAGLTADQMAEKSATVFYGITSRNPEAALPEGESLQVFYDRIIGFLHRVIRQHSGETLLLVAHGGVLDCIYRYAKGLSLQTQRTWLLPNTALNVIDVSPENAINIQLWGDLTHESDNVSKPSLDEVDSRVA